MTDARELEVAELISAQYARAQQARIEELEAQLSTARNDALDEAAKIAWDTDAKYMRKQYTVEHNRKRYDVFGVERCDNKVANVISEDIHNAILSLKTTP